MRDTAFEYLCACAAKRERASYGDIWTTVGTAVGKDLGPSWRQLPILLEYVCRRSLEEFDVLASTLVIHDPDDATSGPGSGFFSLAVSEGLLDEDDRPEDASQWTMTDRQRSFWRQQVDAMFDRFSEQ